MIAADQNVETLCHFGLTTTQAKVYIATVRLGLATVGQISKFSRVRREDVYRILPRLEQMGLVERALGTPTKIRATSIEDALSVLIEHEQKDATQRITKLATEKEQFLKRFNSYDRSSIPEKEEVNFALLCHRDSILAKISAMLKTARKEIDIVCSRTKLVQLVSSYADSLKKCTRRNVRIRMISGFREHGDSVPRIVEEYLSPKNSVDLKFADRSLSHYILVDLKEALIATTTEGNMAENPCLWTDNANLVGLLQRSFEDLWHTSVGWQSIETNSAPEKTILFVEQLKPTNHVIFVYDTLEAKHHVLFSYLKSGLDTGEAAVYVASEEKPSEIREAMRQFGIDVEKLESIGALKILGFRDVYIVDGKFSMNTTLSIWNGFYKETLAKGLKGLRVAGETECFFKHNLVQELIAYEKTLHTVLDIPMIAVCAYNAATLASSSDPINLYTQLVAAHGTVLFTGMDSRIGRIEMRKS